MNVGCFDEVPGRLYRQQQDNLAKALATEFVLVGMSRSSECSVPMIDYHFRWKSLFPKSSFDHEAFGRACQRLQSILSNGMDCQFVLVDYSSKCVIRDGVAVTLRVSPRPLDWPSESPLT